MFISWIAILIRSQSGWIASTAAGVSLAGGSFLASVGLPVLPQFARHDGQMAASSGYPVRIRLDKRQPSSVSLQGGVSDQKVFTPAEVLPEGTLAKVQGVRSDHSTKSRLSVVRTFGTNG